MTVQKILASDLDSTLIFQRRISPDTVAAINRWRAAGNIAVCATGKSIAATQHALRTSKLQFDYYVLYTGAVVTDSEFHILTSHTLPNTLVLELVDALSREPGVGVFATTLDTNDVRLSSTLAPELSTDILQHFDPMLLDDVPHHTFVGIPLWIHTGATTEASITRIHNWIMEHYGTKVDCHRNQDFLDIVPPNCTKRSGLEWLMSYLGDSSLAGFETYSLGDSWNDIDMHRWADHSVSFPHSPDEIQTMTETVATSAADYINEVLRQ